jgi:hypothetical protein
MIPKMVFEELETKYDLSKLKKLETEEIIDMVHKAKCGKLKGLDTSNMSKEDLITHLINSKCPEVHKMILEFTDFNNELYDFVNNFVTDGAKITKDNVYYSGLQSVIIEMFFYKVYKNNKYDCIILPNDLDMTYTYALSFSIFKGTSAEYKVDIKMLKKITKQIEECIDRGVKLIIIPIGIEGIGGGHANALIYRVDANTFERYEPHGSITGFSKYNDDYKYIKALINLLHTLLLPKPEFKKEIYKIDGLVKYYGEEFDKIEAEKDKYESKGNKRKVEELKIKSLAAFNKFENSLEESIIKFKKVYITFLEKYIDVKSIEKLKSLKITTDNITENINNHINVELKKLVTETIPSISNIKNAKYIPPDLISPEKGLQSYEASQVKKKFNFSNQEYSDRIGGFCVLWSILYLDLVIKFPNAKSSILNKRLLKLLMNKGEDSFANLALGYLDEFKKLIQNFYNEEKIDFNKFNKDNKYSANITKKISRKLLQYFADNKLIPIAT